MSSIHQKSRTRLNKFFGSRMQVSDSVLLDQRSTYILPSRAGLLMLGVILLMLIGATNYQNNLAFMLTFLTASIGLVSILFTFKNLQGLTFKKGAVKAVCVGETIVLPIYINSLDQQPRSSIGIGLAKKELTYFNVLERASTQVIITLLSKKRGWFEIPRIMVNSSFPFGLFNTWSWFKFSSPVLIYPQPIEPPAFGGSNNSAEESDGQTIRGTDELYGLKRYIPGEPISRIDWKALAREKGLFSKEFVEYQGQELFFCWDDFLAYEDEFILSYLCHLVLQANKNNFDYGLKIPGTIIQTDSGPVHLANCLTALALYGSN